MQARRLFRGSGALAEAREATCRSVSQSRELLGVDRLAAQYCSLHSLRLHLERRRLCDQRSLRLCELVGPAEIGRVRRDKVTPTSRLRASAVQAGEHLVPFVTFDRFIFGRLAIPGRVLTGRSTAKAGLSIKLLRSSANCDARCPCVLSLSSSLVGCYAMPSGITD